MANFFHRILLTDCFRSPMLLMSLAKQVLDKLVEENFAMKGCVSRRLVNLPLDSCYLVGAADSIETSFNKPAVLVSDF